MMEIRNPQFNSNGTIDCEVNHPEFGWVPFTASPDDPEKHGREIHAAALVMNPAPYTPPPPSTPAEKTAKSMKLAAERMTDPLVMVLVRSVGVPLAQFETDLAAEIRLGL